MRNRRNSIEVKKKKQQLYHDAFEIHFIKLGCSSSEAKYKADKALEKKAF